MVAKYKYTALRTGLETSIAWTRRSFFASTPHGLCVLNWSRKSIASTIESTWRDSRTAANSAPAEPMHAP